MSNYNSDARAGRGRGNNYTDKWYNSPLWDTVESKKKAAKRLYKENNEDDQDWGDELDRRFEDDEREFKRKAKRAYSSAY